MNNNMNNMRDMNSMNAMNPMGNMREMNPQVGMNPNMRTEMGPMVGGMNNMNIPPQRDMIAPPSMGNMNMGPPQMAGSPMNNNPMSNMNITSMLGKMIQNQGMVYKPHVPGDMNQLSQGYPQPGPHPVHPHSNHGGAPQMGPMNNLNAGMVPNNMNQQMQPPLMNNNPGPMQGFPLQSGGNVALFKIPPDATNCLYIDGVPIDATEREVAHIFRPFPGYKCARLIRKKSKGREFYFCFVDFENSLQSTIALNTLDGYRFDKDDKYGLKIQYASEPRGSDKDKHNKFNRRSYDNSRRRKK